MNALSPPPRRPRTHGEIAHAIIMARMSLVLAEAQVEKARARLDALLAEEAARTPLIPDRTAETGA